MNNDLETEVRRKTLPLWWMMLTSAALIALAAYFFIDGKTEAGVLALIWGEIRSGFWFLKKPGY